MSTNNKNRGDDVNGHPINGRIAHHTGRSLLSPARAPVQHRSLSRIVSARIAYSFTEKLIGCAIHTPTGRSRSMAGENRIRLAMLRAASSSRS